MKIYIQTKNNKKYYISFRKVLRNIIVILAFIGIIKYISFMNNYNNKLLAEYEKFVEYAKNNDIAITQENYNSYIKNENIYK